ncbi:MAG: hybrid sensory kinase in two-component regulatory system with RcsB and YojN [Methanosaeta sp. PtaU1.Bin060]|nr:MAG: hybrid sensory kinase in two-component regulatory system with RcsB and YojN [Methanosaeta sp. PtaU1.Bin060]
MCSEGGDRPSILLVEDTPVNQKVALKMLNHLGYQADLATNGLEALHALKQRLYDIVLMDIHMPQMDGLQATKAIRGELPHADQPYIIAITAYATRFDRAMCMSAGMDDYLSKPFTVEDLKLALFRYSGQQ